MVRYALKCGFETSSSLDTALSMETSSGCVSGLLVSFAPYLTICT